MAEYAEKNCAVCGRRFTPKTPVGKYCGPECAHKAKQEHERAWRLSHRSPRQSEPGACDSAENIKKCLACTRAKCTGNCKAMA